MFGLLNTTHIYGIQQEPEHKFNLNDIDYPHTANNYKSHHRRTQSSLSDSGNKLLSSLASRTPTHFIEKIFKSDVLFTYETLKSYTHFNTSLSSNGDTTDPLDTPKESASSFNCLQGRYRHSFDGEFYEKISLRRTPTSSSLKTNEMTIKCSKNLLAVEPEIQGPATLQNYQKLPESDHNLGTETLLPSSGASSGEFNSSSDASTGINGGSSNNGSLSTSSSSAASNLYKRLSFGNRNIQHKLDKQQNQQEEVLNSTCLNSSLSYTQKAIDVQRSSSSTSAAGDSRIKVERKKVTMTPQSEEPALSKRMSLIATANTVSPSQISLEKSQRRKLLQMISNYELNNKLLQRELAKEKRRRTEELACVVKALLCFESKLVYDMKTVNQRLLEKDLEICRLVRQNRALRKKLCKLQADAKESIRDEGVVEDAGDNGDNSNEDSNDLLEDCLILEALQCISCRKQFYDMEMKENSTQTMRGGIVDGCQNGGSRSNDPTTEHGSSSDETASSFFGARRSVRYTSKRTSGTFRDYMRSRAMNIDDPALDNYDNVEECPSSARCDANQTCCAKVNIYSRTIERLHGVKCESENDSEHSGLETASSVTRSGSRASTKSFKSNSTTTSKSSELSNAHEVDDGDDDDDDDDGIFSPTQDEEFDDDQRTDLAKLKIVCGRTSDVFSEASPKQIYETSTDDWYASASDQDEIPDSVTSKSYGQSFSCVNPVLECVNQILLQQSMEGVEERSQTPKNCTTLPRRSSLSDRRSRNNSRASDGATPNSRNGTLTRKRVHFSTKNSMVHVPRNDETDDDDDRKNTNHTDVTYQSLGTYMSHSPALDSTASASERLVETFNYESVYSNEYEPIGSEFNSSNLYVDMDTATKNGGNSENHSTESPNKGCKLPPALPPKPANLLKFKKSLQQLDESPDEQIDAVNVELEPDYCSISDVNVGITSVQIRADVHRIPLSDREQEYDGEAELETATVTSEAATQKTEEIEEIFADIPKLPNVAAIIAPKSALKPSDYLEMTPKGDSKFGVSALSPASSNIPLTKIHKPDRSNLTLNLTPLNGLQTNVSKSQKLDSFTLLPHISSANYKRKHMPNILQEINKRLSLPNSPNTQSTTKLCNNITPKNNNNKTEAEVHNSLPMHAEFDWYNLDAEYGKIPQFDLSKVNENMNSGITSLLADIKEDGESSIHTADEYNLDEEFTNESYNELEEQKNEEVVKPEQLCEAINPVHIRAKQIQKNLENFEKFIETSGLILNAKTSASKKKIFV